MNASYMHCLKGIPTEAVPREARISFLSNSIDKIGMVSVDSHAMLAACGIDMPKDLPRLTVDDHMNGSKDLEDKKRVLRMASTELREKFFPGSTAFWEDFYKKVELDYTYDADYDLNRFDSNGLPFFDDAKPFEALQPF